MSSSSGIINCQCSFKEKGGLPSLSFIHNGMLKGWILCVSTHLSWFHESSGFVMSRIKKKNCGNFLSFQALIFFLLPFPQGFWELEAEHTIVNSSTSYESVHQQQPAEERKITYSKADVFYFIVESFHFVRAYNIGLWQLLLNMGSKSHLCCIGLVFMNWLFFLI